jgi:hypothetical protein
MMRLGLLRRQMHAGISAHGFASSGTGPPPNLAPVSTRKTSGFRLKIEVAGDVAAASATIVMTGPPL